MFMFLLIISEETFGRFEFILNKWKAHNFLSLNVFQALNSNVQPQKKIVLFHIPRELRGKVGEMGRGMPTSMYILMLPADLTKFFQILNYNSVVEQISGRDTILQIHLFLKKGTYLTTQCKYL